LTVGAVAYLTTPQDITSQLLVIPNAISGVLFPLFAQDFSVRSRQSVDMLKQGARYVFLLVFPVSIALAIFARPGLSLWLGEEFANNSSTVMCLCSVALLFSATAFIPNAALQGAHRPDIPSKVYLAEASLYAFTTWWLIKVFGVEGAALSFLLRTVIETLIFWGAAQRVTSRESDLFAYVVKLLVMPTLFLFAGLAALGNVGRALVCVLAFGNWVVVLVQSDMLNRVRGQIRDQFV
jgi:O-antigen/teichoic acid export membrane protein